VRFCSSVYNNYKNAVDTSSLYGSLSLLPDFLKECQLNDNDYTLAYLKNKKNEIIKIMETLTKNE
jgi:hypothetical protein